MDILPRNQQILVAQEYRRLIGDLNKMQVWEAGSLISGSPLGDDSFEYFRNWILWSGEKVFFTLTSNPDNLLECDVNFSSPFFEGLSVCSTYLSEPNLISPLAAQDFESNDWDWRDSSSARMAADLPKLWKVYGSNFSWTTVGDVLLADSFYAPGLGCLKVGDRVFHKHGYGEGVIADVLIPDNAIAQIKFSSEIKTYRITSDYFDVIS